MLMNQDDIKEEVRVPLWTSLVLLDTVQQITQISQVSITCMLLYFICRLESKCLKVVLISLSVRDEMGLELKFNVDDSV